MHIPLNIIIVIVHMLRRRSRGDDKARLHRQGAGGSQPGAIECKVLMLLLMMLLWSLRRMNAAGLQDR